MHVELGRSQVEVQGCTLSWEVGKELGEEWRKRRERRRRKRRRRRRKRTTLIKSNNPHLAGGEQSFRKCMGVVLFNGFQQRMK